MSIRLILVVLFCTILPGPCFFAAGSRADNNIEFLDKQLIQELNLGIYEVVTPKLEGDTITYQRELPFDKLDFIERNEKYFSIGTAFFINDKELMTAAHVFSLQFFSLLNNFYIRDIDGNVYPIKVIKKLSTHRDMVVFELEKYPAAKRPLPLNEQVDIGDTVFSVGNAQGEGIAYRAGQVASFTPEREYGKWKDIRFTSPASPGNSGGPLLNLKGEVVGVIVQKNENENYNVAVPIQELKNLSDKAEFHIRNVNIGILGVNETLSRDWNYTVALPAKVAQVAAKAQDSLDNLMQSMHDDISEKVKEKNFPLGKRFRSYLRNQTIVKGLATLLPETDFKTWYVAKGYQEKIPISVSQNIYTGKARIADLHVIIEKPQGVALKDFLASPMQIIDNLLKGLPYNRQVGVEDIPIVSLGEPAKHQIIEDKLGRHWITSLWDLPYSDSFVYSSCLPYPKGVVCHIDSKSNGYRKYGYFDNIHDSYDEIVIGYEGTIADWIEYFSLEDEYLPRFFKKSSITFNDDKLQVKLKEFEVNFASTKLKDNSMVHFHLGYSNTELLAEELLLFEVFPQKGAKAHYRVQPYYQPNHFNSDRYQSRWLDIIDGTGQYSGLPVNKGEKISIRKSVEKTRQTVTTFDDQKLAKIFVAGCTYQPTDTGIEKDCQNFLDSVIFH